MVIAQAHILAGLSWDPALKGIFVVLVGVVVLMGSIYLIVSTNTGARLGFLIVAGSLFGFLSIMTLNWWITPPGIGPRGQDPSWKPVEVFVHGSNYTTVISSGSRDPAKTAVFDQLPQPVDIPTATRFIQENPEFAAAFALPPDQVSLTEVAGAKATLPDGSTVTGASILRDKYGIVVSDEEKLGVSGEALGGWKLLSSSQAGDASAAADPALVQFGFKDATEYKKLDAFEIGGNSKRGEECADSDLLCRAWFRVKKTFKVLHPPRYQVVQVQPVIKQEAKPGEAPPIPTVDPTRPVISVVMIRDQGNVRAKPAYFFAISFSLFLVFVLILHYRDKTLRRNLDEAEEAKAKAGA